MAFCWSTIWKRFRDRPFKLYARRVQSLTCFRFSRFPRTHLRAELNSIQESANSRSKCSSIPTPKYYSTPPKRSIHHFCFLCSLFIFGIFLGAIPVNCTRYWNVTNSQNIHMENCKQCGSKPIITKRKNYVDDL